MDKRILCMAMLLFVAGPVWAERSEHWTTITASVEDFRVGSNSGVEARRRWIPAGESLTLEMGQVLATPGVVVHLWLNDADGVTPIGSPWMAWTTGAYQDLPHGWTIHGPVYLILLVINTTAQAVPVYYTITWTVHP